MGGEEKSRRKTAAADRREAALEAVGRALRRDLAELDLEAPSDAELRAMQARGELPGDGELAREHP